MRNSFFRSWSFLLVYLSFFILLKFSTVQLSDRRMVALSKGDSVNWNFLQLSKTSIFHYQLFTSRYLLKVLSRKIGLATSYRFMYNANSYLSDFLPKNNRMMTSFWNLTLASPLSWWNFFFGSVVAPFILLAGDF